MSTSPFALLPAVPLDDLKLEEVPEEVRQRISGVKMETDFHEATTLRDQLGVACGFLTDPELGLSR
jgi:hypothetical protein